MEIINNSTSQLVAAYNIVLAESAVCKLWEVGRLMGGLKTDYNELKTTHSIKEINSSHCFKDTMQVNVSE